MSDNQHDNQSDEATPSTETGESVCSDADVEKTIQECGANLLTLDPSEVPPDEKSPMESTPLQPKKDGKGPVKLF